jgi:hypothetical protein
MVKEKTMLSSTGMTKLQLATLAILHVALLEVCMGMGMNGFPLNP